MILKAWLMLLVVWLVAAQTVSGQYLSGISSSNYAGTNALYQNPAQAADSRFKVYVNLATVDAYLNNSFLSWNAPFSFLSFATNTIPNQYRNERGQVRWSKSYLQERLNGRLKQLTTGADLRGPSLLINLNEEWGLGLTTRVRSGVSFRKTSEEFARVLHYSPQVAQLLNQGSTSQQGYVNGNAYAELAATLGKVLVDNGEDFWKAGVTLKRVVGLYNAHIHVDEATHTLIRDPQRRGFTALDFPTIRGAVGYTSQEAFENASPSPGWLLGNQSAGGGWGLDLGIVYEYRPNARRYRYRDRTGNHSDGSVNKYKYRISAALLDFGAIRYKNPAYVNQYEVDVRNRRLTQGYFNNIKSSDEAGERLVNFTGVPESARGTNYRAGLPTALNLSIDYQATNRLYVSGLWTHSLAGVRSKAMQTPSMVGVVPRWESRWLEVSMPVLLQSNYSMLTVGLAARLGPVFVGTDHLGGLINLGNPRGVSVYAGAGIPLYRKAPGDPNPCWDPNGKKSFWNIFRRKN
ncbi:DUF5723 family protein [Tellurirhabdus bombi]|uniref:DUF5723 family protein n=1 Tax=Tellurirhabdus bombi TaxID=2907205 RepID=UPI001F241468|nr:DUF5723 family protein [Tellurirhabdus bombi]